MVRVPQHVLCGPALVLGALLSLVAGAAAQNEASGVTLPPVRLTSNEVKRLLVTAVPPRYPALARINYIQGHVRVEILISPRGRVEQAHVIKGHPFLAAAALNTIQLWKFRPYKLAHQARPVLSVVDLHFVLHNPKLAPLPPAPEDDLNRQVSPPRLMGTVPTSGDLVPMRVLVGQHGNVLDSLPDGGPPAESQEARQSLKHLKFLPAHWGALPVPWYVEVRVPVPVGR
jgi:TonB family protein